MEWVGLLEKLGIFSVGSICIIGLIAFLGKKGLEFLLSRDVEKYKSSLEIESIRHKSELDQKLELYKAELTRINFEHQIRFSKLHSDRAEVIKELFKRMVQVQDSMESLMRPVQFVNEVPIVEKLKMSGTLGNNFLEYYKENEILFNDETCHLINTIQEMFLNAWKDFKLAEEFKDATTPDLQMELYQTRFKTYDQTLMTEIPKLKKELIAEFRKILAG